MTIVPPVQPDTHGNDKTNVPPLIPEEELNDVVDLADHAELANLTDKVYAEKDLEMFRTYHPKDSANAVYFIKGWLPCSADTLFNVFLDMRYRKTWDSSAKQLYVLDRDKDIEVVYWCVRFPWPLTNRDYVYSRRTKFFAKQHTFAMVTKAMHHPSAPECNGVVRVQTFHSKVCIRATGTNSCDFHIEYMDDTAFNTPSYLMNVILGGNVAPMFQELKHACENYANFIKSLSDEETVQLTPAQTLRHRWENTAKRSGTIPSNSHHGSLTRTLTVGQLNGRPSSSSCITSDAAQEDDLTVRNANKHLWKRSFRKPKDDCELASSERTMHQNQLQTSPSKSKLLFSKRKQLKATTSSPHIIIPPSTCSLPSTVCHDSGEVQTPHDSSGELSCSGVEVLEDDFTVVFQNQKIGLHLETEIFSNKVVVASCEKNSEAAQSSVSLEPGYILSSINGTNVGLMTFPQVMERIKTSQRPITLGFANSDRHNSKQYRRFAQQQQQMKTCVNGYITRDNVNEFVSCLKPCHQSLKSGSRRENNHRGALLIKPFGVVSVKSVYKSSEDQDAQTVPSGFFVRDIDGSQVTHLPLSEIVHLLRKNAEIPKLVTFQNVLAPDVASKKSKTAPPPFLNKNKKSPSLSKKLKGVFRWRSGSFDEDPVVPRNDVSHQDAPPKMMAPELNNSRPLGGQESSVSAGASSTPDGDLLASTQECLHDYSNVIVSARNIRHAWRHMELCREQERLFSAALLVDRIEECLMQKQPHHSDEQSRLEESTANVKFVLNEMRAKRQELDDLKKKRAGGLRALRDFNSGDGDSDWKFAQTYFGVSTHWKNGEEGTIWLKMEGICEGVDLFNSLAVMREVDLYSLWTPFCNKSLLLKQVSRVEMVVYLSIALPFLQRDCVVHAFGINAVYEYRGVLLVGESIDAARQKELEVHAPLCKGWNSDRVDVRGFRAIIEPLARDKSRICMVANIDPKCPLPKTLINFATRKVAGVLLYLEMREAEKIEKIQKEQANSHKPSKQQNEHLRRIREDPTGFYEFLARGLDEWFELKRQNLLPPLLAIPSVSASNEVDSHDAWRTGVLSSASSSTGDSPRKSLLRARSIFHGNNTVSSSNEYGGSSSSSSSSVQLKRSWMDAAYEFGVWPFVLLFLVSHVTPNRSFFEVAALKLLFTCTCTWFGVPGAMSFKTRATKRLTGELDAMCRKWALVALVYDLVNSWFNHLWVHWLLCASYFWFPISQTLCLQRDATALRESEHFWLMASCFVFATGIVAIQIMINI